jgi:heme O synthase-like polyprenyltransferase
MSNPSSAAEFTLCDPPPLGPPRSSSDRFMRRLLRLPADAPRADANQARKAFQTSLAVATVRCMLMYVVFPFVLPLLGVAKGVGPWIGLVISVLAIGAITMSIRRFWRADHSKRWHYTIFGTVVMCLLVVLVVQDIVEIVS